MAVSVPAPAILVLLASLIVGVLGLRAFIETWAQQGAMRDRALEDVERRAGSIRGRIDRALRRTGLGQDLVIRLAAAGVEMRPIDFTLMVVAVFVAGFALADTLLPGWLAGLAGVACARGCWTWIEWKREKRRESFIAQLPEVARLLSNASSAGLAIRTAIDMAANELDEPAASEMGLVSQELRIGQSVEGALENLEKRMPSRDVAVLISTLVIQQRAGGDLVRALQEMAETLDSRRDLRREVRTVLAGSIFTGYLVAGMGLAATLVLNSISPGAIESMASRPLGQLILVIAGALYALGFFLVRKTTDLHV